MEIGSIIELNGEHGFRSVKIDKEYEVLFISDIAIVLINDDGHRVTYGREYFISKKEKRASTLNSIIKINK